jgi:ribokinase
MPEIVLVGSLNMDLVVRTPRLPRPGETIIGHEFITAPGGKGANQTVAAAKLGAAVSMVGRVGADDFGRALRANLRAAGADDTYVSTDAEAATGIAMIGVEDSGQNSIIVAPGANGRVTPADVDAARLAIASAKALIVQLEIPLATVWQALRLARAANILTILNPAPAQALAPDLLGLVDVLIPNETEATLLTGLEVTDFASAEQAARSLHERGARVVVVTLGQRGALVLEDSLARQVEAFPVKAIDTTAAGDAFVGAFAVVRAAGRDLDTALREASAAGALAATKFGAQPSLPTRAELDDFLQRRASHTLRL